MTLSLSAAVDTSKTYTIDYAAPMTSPIKDLVGNAAGDVSAQSVSTVDTTAPTLDGASTYTVGGGTGISLDFSETIDGTSIPAASAFTVKINDEDVVESSVSRSTTNTDVINVVLGSNPRPGDSVTIEYAKPSLNPLKDAADNAVASFSPVVVDNTLAATAPEAPRSLAAGTYNISTTPVRVAADILELSWIIPWHNGSPIEKFQYRYATGSSVPPSTTWVDIPNSTPGHPNDTDFDVTGLDADTEYTFEVQAVNGIGASTASSVTRRTLAPAWSFTLRDSSNANVTELTEGGDSATAEVSITNTVRFSTAQTVTLMWGTVDLSFGSIVGAGGASTITIPANGDSGSLVISSPQRVGEVYDRPRTEPLTATHGGTQIGNSIDLTRLDDEEPPVASITSAPTTVNEGGNIEIELALSVSYSGAGAIRFTVTDSDGALSGTPDDRVVLAGGQKTQTFTLTTDDNSVQSDGTREVTVTLGLSTDIPYTLGTPSSVTIKVRDDDTPPLAPQNLRAQAGNTEATLSWQAPLPSTPDHEQPVLRYEYQVKVGNGSFTSWATFLGSNANTRSHTFTGLTNGTEYTYKVRAVNVAGGGAEDEVMVTPIVGVAVSFGAAALSVNEGDNAVVTVTLAEAPAAGTTVTVPIVATGSGLIIVVPVPTQAIFAAGETSKSFVMHTIQDTFDTPDEVLTLSLGTLPAGYVPGTHATFELTVVDDDVPFVSATFGAAAASAPEGGSVEVTVTLTSEPEREVVVPIRAARGANLAADEYEGVAASVTFAADETSKSFTVTFADDAVVEGNETLTLTFGTRPERVTQGANPQLVLTVTDDDGPPAAPDVSAQTGDGYVALSWTAVSNDSPVLRYEVRWRETDGGTFGTPLDVGLVTRYRVEGLTNGMAYEFQVRAVNAHGDGEAGSAPGTPTARLTGIPKAVQVLQVKATDSGRAELSWAGPANATDRVTANSATATFSQIQGYRIEVCRTTCDDEANWYAVVPNTRAFEHKYVHQVLAPGVIRENHYRVQAININGKTGPWSNVATLEATVLDRFWLVSPGSETVDVHVTVWHPDGNPLYVRYADTSDPMSVQYAQKRLTTKGEVAVKLAVQASTHYRVDVDFVDTFDSPRLRSGTVWSLQEGADPYTSPYAVDALDAQVYQNGTWRNAPDTQLYVRMGGTGKYRVRLKENPDLGILGTACSEERRVYARRIQAPSGALRASPMEVDPFQMNLRCNANAWREVTVTALALEDYPSDRRADALLRTPFAVVYNHEVWQDRSTIQSVLVSEGTGLVRVSVDRPAGATLPVPTGVTIANPAAGGSGGPTMSWDAVPGASEYLVNWRYGVRYSAGANADRSRRTATSVTLPFGASRRGPITARVRAFSASGVSAWSAELTWDSRPPTLNVLDTAVNEDDGSVGFLVTLSPAASGTVTVDYATQDDGTAVAGTDYTATSGTLTFAPGETRKSTALVPIADDGEEDSGETFRLVLSNPTGSDANNGAAVLGDAEAVGTILNSEREAAALTGFTLVDAGTNGDLMVLADGSTVELGALLAPSYGIRAETGPGAAPGSVRLALSGAKTVTHTDDAAPYSLYGDGAGRVNGAALPPGSYTLRATAYADSGGRGEERGSLEVSFTVTAGALGVTTPGPFRVAEGTTAVTTLGASQTGTGESVSWSIPEGTAGGADGAAFTLDPDGTLALRAAKDFEAPDDADGDGTYAVTVVARAGAQTATAALLVRLADANEAPVAKATADRSVVREGAAVTLDAGASTDPDAGDRLSYAWTQTDEGGPRVTLSDASAAQPVFTAPSDLAAEAELAFTLRATDAGGLYAEDTVTVTVSLISEVAIAAASDYAAEGAEAVFRLSRAGSALKALTVPVTVEETGAMLGADVPAEATFAAGARETELRVTTAADAVSETDSLVTVRLGSGSGWQLAADAASASLTVLDDDVAPVDVAAADVTVWSADMTVVAYGPRSIGAGTADLFSNQMGRAGLRAKWLWYDPSARQLKLGFDDGLDDAESLTLHVGGVSLGFPDNTGGNSSFTLEGVDIAWTDGETVAARVSKPSTEAVSTDATLASLTVEGATLSPAFDAGVLVYRAAVDAGVETVTVAALANDGGAAVTYGPADDADTELADHEVAVLDEGETLVEVTVTAADGTVRRYRVVVARAADGANVAPTGLPAISGTPRVGEALTASAAAVADADGTANAAFAWQWLTNDGTDDTAIAGATGESWTLTAAEAGRTVRVRVTFTDDKGTEETLTSAPTVAVAAVAPSAPVGIAVVTAEGRERELTVSWSAPQSDGGSEVTGYRVQWKSGTEAYDGSQASTRQAVLGDAAAVSHTIAGLVNGTAYTVRVLAVNAAGDGAAAEAGATAEDRVAPVLAGAVVDGTVLTLTFSEALDTDSKPAAGAFTVTVADTARGVDGVALSGSAVELRLASAVVADETVTVGYAVPSDADAARIEDAAGNDAASFTGEAAANRTEASNAAPTGLPEISGTPEVGEELTASAAAITDEDGLDNAIFAYQWLANDGTDDGEIAGATGATHEVAPEQAGKTLKVRVTFTDDKGTAETLTSAATVAVAARAPDAPGGLTVATAAGREGELDVSWVAPESDGGSEVTGYKVQWKSGTEAYDGSQASTRQAVLGDAAAVSHTIAGLVNGTAYTVRVLAVNAAGDGAAAEAGATAEDRVAPVLAGAVVDGTVLTLTFSEALDTDSKPAAGAFTVTVADTARGVDGVALSGSAVELRLASAVAADETVTVGYAVPSDADAARIEDAAANRTEASNAAPTGLPEISGTPEVGEELTASAAAITDEDGLDNAIFAYQWLANDGTDDGEIAGATGATHEVAPEQAGKTLKVRVTFTDDKGTAETLTSAATVAVAARAPDAPGGLTVATAAGREGELDVSWVAPESDGGSEVTGYKVQWKSGTEAYDGSQASTRQAVLGDAAAVSHTIAGLVNGTAYTVRVLAVNAAGDGAAAEAGATAEDRVAPVLAGAVVDGTVLTLTFSEALDTDSKPAAGAFTVTVADTARGVDGVALSGSAVELTLASAVVADETVTVGYTPPTGTGAGALQDAADNAAAGFTGEAAANDTPAGNTKPSGLPAITGTAQVGEVLTASADAITDADGLESATFAWQWLAVDGSEDTEIAGATGATHEVAPEQAGQTLKVRVTFTDDKGTAETLVSAATEVVTVRLTAAFENLPSAHDGASIFTFRVRFSESPALSYTVLRDQSFAVTGGEVDKARRVDGRNDLREIHVEPTGYDDVTVTLAGGRACGTYGAICTDDGRALSNTLSATVQGPPALNVADARAVEGEDATLDFVVTLSRAASGTVSVDYATADGSATAGDDYSAASGTLTFAAGETTKPVSVAVLDDAVNDGEETFTLTLSNPAGAWIEDGEATGTIENNDPLPVAWTARFGRSVATHLLDALEARLETASGSYVRLGGHQLGGAPDVKEAVERLAPDNNLSLWEEAELADAVGRDVTVKELLLGSAFHLVSNPDEAATGPRLSAWGRVATSGFDGQEDKLSLNGTVTTATLGVDGVWKHWLTGVALAYSEGDGSFTQVEAAGGDLASSLTSVHPYVAYALSDRVRLWGMVGYGSGSLQLKLAEQHAMDTDLTMTMGALGVRGSLLEPSQPQGGLALALRSDVLWLRMDTAAVAGMLATESDVSRLRLVLEGSRPISLAAGGSLIPTLEVGLRHDGGDAETGSGVEVGGRLRYTSAWGLSIEAAVRGLLAHEASDYREWGASGALRFDPGKQGRGLTASIMPTWGSAASGVSRLWGQPDASGLAVDNALATATAGRLDAELGYGLATLQGRGLLTPYVRAALVESDSQAWHVGARLALAGSLNFSVEASRRQREGDVAAHEVALLATLGW